MNIKKVLLIVSAGAVVAISGCSTYQGGTGEDYSTSTGQGAYPTPMGSPTFRPGMNPYDLRDPQALTQPRPPNPQPPLAPDATQPRMTPGTTP